MNVEGFSLTSVTFTHGIRHVIVCVHCMDSMDSDDCALLMIIQEIYHNSVVTID